MSATSCSCWTGHSPVESGRLAAVWLWLMTGLLLLVAWYQPLAHWVYPLALVLLPTVAWLEWYFRPRFSAIHYRPEGVTLVARDGSRWLSAAGEPAICYPLWVSMQVCGPGRRRWVTLFRDQLPAEHWRRLRVVLRWR